MIPEALLARVPDRRRCIVSLCYDDALPCHHEMVAPLLETHGLRATFYTHLQSRFLPDVDRWRGVAAAGHELGNHTVFHPCQDQKWLDRTHNLRHYTPRRWCDEVQLANAVLQTVDGCTRRTFGNTCHDNRVGEGEGVVLIETLAPNYFIAARGEHTRRAVDFSSLNWFNLGNRVIDGASFAELSTELSALAQAGGWILYTMHGVGPRDHELHIAVDQHRRLIEWLAAHDDAVWVAPVRTVAETLQPSADTRALSGAATSSDRDGCARG